MAYNLRNTASKSCLFPTVYMCQKVWQLVGRRQSYCNNSHQLTF